jgi:hypothetical protein
MIFLGLNTSNTELLDFNLSNVLIKDLFELQQGIPVSVKKSTKIGDEFNLIQPSDVKYLSKNELNCNFKKIQFNKSISNLKHLAVNDYIVTCKGSSLQGFGFRDKFFFTRNPNTIVNSHIIILRPLTNSILSTHKYYIPFIHFLINRFIESYNKTNTKLFITIKDLEQTEVLRTLNLEQLNSFGKLFEEYSYFLSKFSKIENHLNNFINSL